MSAIKRLGITSDKNKTLEYTDEQAQTGSAFGYQWSRRDTYESEASKKAMKEMACGKILR